MNRNLNHFCNVANKLQSQTPVRFTAEIEIKIEILIYISLAIAKLRCNIHPSQLIEHCQWRRKMQQNEMPPFSELKPLGEFMGQLNVNRSTLIRWVTRGSNPGPVKLRAWKVKEWLTTQEEVARFIQKKTEATIAKASAMPASVDSKSHTAAKKRLKAAGFKVN